MSQQDLPSDADFVYLSENGRELVNELAAKQEFQTKGHPGKKLKPYYIFRDGNDVPKDIEKKESKVIRQTFGQRSVSQVAKVQ